MDPSQKSTERERFFTDLNEWLSRRGINLGELPSGAMTDTEHAADAHTMAIDGRDVSVDGIKLDTIEPGATGDQVAGEVEVEEYEEATHDDLQAWLNNTQSAGYVEGGELSPHTGPDGTLDISAVKGFFKSSDSAIGVTKSFDLAAVSGMVLEDGKVSYIYIHKSLVLVDPPVFAVTTDRTDIELNLDFTLGRVYRSGTSLHIIQSGIQLSNFLRREHERTLAVRGFERASGGDISEVGTRSIASTAGVFYLGLNKETTSSKTGPGDPFTAWYYNGTAWVPESQTQIDNFYYNNVASGKVELGANKYGVHWVFVHFDSDLHVVYGQDSYKLSEAQGATLPASLPDAVSKFGVLAAKIIIKKEAPAFTDIAGAYSVLFPVTAPAEHNDLPGIQGGAEGDYYHLTSANVGKLGGIETGATADQTGLEIVVLLQALAAGSKLDHGAGLKGLTDDDHTQYLLAAGTRALSADWAVGSHKITGLTDPTGAQDAATKAFVVNPDTLIDTLAAKRFLFLDLTTYDMFETDTSGSGSIAKGLMIAYVATGAVAGSSARQNLNSQETYVQTYWYQELSTDFMSGNSLAFAGIIRTTKLTETQTTSNLTDQHVGIWYEDGQWYASCADGTTQTKSAITISGRGALIIDGRTAGHMLFYWEGEEVADITTNIPVTYGFLQWYVYNKALSADNRLFLYCAAYRAPT